MTTACLLHFDGDVANMVRWIGGPHTNAHLNVQKVLTTLEPVIEKDVFDDVKRILTLGAPAYCNSSASEKNFQEFKNYGNQVCERKPVSVRINNHQTKQKGTYLNHGPSNDQFFIECPPDTAGSRRHL